VLDEAVTRQHKTELARILKTPEPTWTIAIHLMHRTLAIEPERIAGAGQGDASWAYIDKITFPTGLVELEPRLGIIFHKTWFSEESKRCGATPIWRRSALKREATRSAVSKIRSRWCSAMPTCRLSTPQEKDLPTWRHVTTLQEKTPVQSIQHDGAYDT